MHAGCSSQTRVKSEGFQVLARARVHREDQRDVGGDALQCLTKPFKYFRIIDIGRAVEGHNAVGAVLEPVFRDRIFSHDPRPHHLQRVYHDVSDPLDLRRRNPLPQKVLVSVRRRSPEDVGNRVGDDAIDLLLRS